MHSLTLLLLARGLLCYGCNDKTTQLRYADGPCMGGIKGVVKMTKPEINEIVGANQSALMPALCIEEVRQMRIDQVKVVRNGEVSYSHHFRPRTDNVPGDFFVMADIAWEPCDDANMPRWMSRYVQSLRDEGCEVEVSSSLGGILCFRMLFRGERIALWFNPWTSTTVVIGSDGKVRKPIFAEESTNT